MRDLGGNYVMLDELAYFDVYPSSDSANFNGAWGTYPYFPSGTIVVSGIEQGLFVLALNIRDELSFVSPGENAVLSGNAVAIEIFARDGDPDAAPPMVQWRVDGGSLRDAESIGANLFAAIWNTQDLNDWFYDLTAVMVDASGAQTTAAISVELRNSDNPPVAWFTNPVDGAAVNGNTTLIATANDDGAVLSVTFFDDGNEIGTDNDPAGGWSVKWNTKKVSQGVHTLTVQALDDGNRFSDPAADNNGTVSVTVGSGNGGGNGGPKCHPKKDPDCIR